MFRVCGGIAPMYRGRPKQTIQTLNPAAAGSGKQHRETKPLTRLLYELNLKNKTLLKILFIEV